MLTCANDLLMEVKKSSSVNTCYFGIGGQGPLHWIISVAIKHVDVPERNPKQLRFNL